MIFHRNRPTRRTTTETFDAKGKLVERLIVETNQPPPTSVQLTGNVRAPGTARITVTTT